MQIVLISWRTLGASELLLLPSLSFLMPVCVFFPPRCLFSCCNCCCFWSLVQPPHHHLDTSPSHPHRRHSSPFLSPPLWSGGWIQVVFHSCADDLLSPSTDTPLEGKLTGSRLLGRWAERWAADGRDPGPLSGISTLMWAGARLSQMFVCFFLSSRRGLTLGFDNDGSELHCSCERLSISSLFISGYRSGGSSENYCFGCLRLDFGYDMIFSCLVFISYF